MIAHIPSPTTPETNPTHFNQPSIWPAGPAIPGGATLMAAPREQQRIASLGAEVVRQAGVLDKVAMIVEHQSAHYRRPHERSDAEVPLASRIIKVANAFDDLVGDSLEGGRRANALERIHLGLAYEYDPRVVTALSRVMSRV